VRVCFSTVSILKFLALNPKCADLLSKYALGHLRVFTLLFDFHQIYSKWKDLVKELSICSVIKTRGLTGDG
jgi:hypothetical protein